MFLKWISKKWPNAAALTLGVSLGLSALAFAAEDPELPKPWPERLLHSIRNLADRTFVELSGALFDSLDKLDTDFLKFPGNGKVGVEVRRDVLDNFDLLNTYTVIDRARIRAEAKPLASLTTWTEDVATTGIGMPYVSAILSPQAAIEWTNVRQVKALDFKKEPSTKELRRRAEAAKRENEERSTSEPLAEATPLPSPSPDPNLSELNPNVSLAFMDPSIRARFSKLPNLLTFPFRLPLHRADVSRMKDGEILAYAFDGQVEVGVSVGLKVIPTLNVLHAGLDISGTVLLHGRYQISVLREDARFARVKLTRLTEKGIKAGIRLGIERKGVFDGVMLFKGTPVELDHVGKYDLNLVPFDLQSSRIKSNQFDVVYRYDLDEPRAKSAFHKAVLGRFKESEEVEATTPGLAKPVEKVIGRQSDRFSKTGDLRVDLGGILRLDWHNKREALAATLELPDGTHHVLEAFREKKRNKRTFFGAAKEDRTRRMTLYLDAELLAKRDPESIFVITEITKEDSDTNAKELKREIDQMEKLLRKPDLLPEIARHIEGRPTLFNQKRAWYGRSSFYYGYSLSLEEIGAFLRTDRATIETAARKYFSVDESTRFIERWAEASASLRANAPAPELFQSLRGLFAAKFSVEPMTNVIFDTLPARLINYFVTAQNVGFGRIQERGKTITSVEKALTNTDRELGFETYSQRLKQDSEAIVRDLHVDSLPGGLKKVKFTLAHSPANIFFRLLRSSGFKRHKYVTEVVVSNFNGRFKLGENSLVLDPNSTDLLVAKLSRGLRLGEYYTLSIAYAQKGDRYGPVSSNRFEALAPYPRAEEN